MRATFDRGRPLTEIGHFIDVYTKGYDPLIDNHYKECVMLVEKAKKKDVRARVKHLKKIKYSIHYHTYTIENFGKIIRYIKKRGFPVNLLCVEDLQEGTAEFIVILKKCSPGLFKNILFSVHRKKKSLLKK